MHTRTRLIIAAAAAVLAASLLPAAAADLPAKPRLLASPAQCTSTACSGFYLGLDVTGMGSNLDVLGSGVRGSLFAGGMNLGGHVGYQVWNGALFGAAEVGCAYDVAQNVGAVGGNPTSRLLCTELVKLGGSLTGLLGGGLAGAPAAPSQGPVAVNVPASLANALVSPYVTIGAAQRHQKTGFAAGAGALFLVSANWNVSLEYLHINYNNAQVGPTTTLDTENLVRIGLNYHFGN